MTKEKSAFKWPYPMEEHVLRLAILDDQALAYAWIEAYADSISGDEGTVTAEELIDTALDNIRHDNDGWGGEYISKGGLLEGESTDPMFWDKLSIYAGIEIPEDKRNSFFSCSC